MTAETSVQNEYRIAIPARVEDPHPLSEIFQQVLGLHPTDAMIWARHVPGILAETFSADQARELTAAISRLGVPVTAIRSAEIPDLHHASSVHHVQCVDTGLQIIGLRGEPEALIPWSAIQLVCVGETPFETIRHDSSGQWSGPSAGHYYQSPGANLPLTPTLEVWITCASPFPNLRIDHERMNYEYLGPRRVDSATVNFKHFIQDLSGRATGAVLTESTQAYIQHVEPDRFRFKSVEDLIRYATLHAVLARETRTDEPFTPDVA